LSYLAIQVALNGTSAAGAAYALTVFMSEDRFVRVEHHKAAAAVDGAQLCL